MPLHLDLTSSPKQLELLGELAFQYKDARIQTHLGEQIEEIEWVRKLFPYSIDYLEFMNVLV